MKIVSKYLIRMDIFCINLERKDQGTGSSTNLVSCQLTKQDTWWSVMKGITEFRCLNWVESLLQSLEHKAEGKESLIDHCQQQFLVMVA